MVTTRSTTLQKEAQKKAFKKASKKVKGAPPDFLSMVSLTKDAETLLKRGPKKTRDDLNRDLQERVKQGMTAELAFSEIIWRTFFPDEAQ